MENELYDVIIIGSGPAGLTAGLYTARGNRKTLIIGGRNWGGQLMLTTEVENFPGFPDGIMGPELMQRMRTQTEKHGAKIVDINFKSANFSKKPFIVTTDDEKMYSGKSIIIATGAATKWLEIPGEKEKIGRGVSSCAPCDAAFYRNKNVIVVGGGDSAMEEALVLTKFASHIYLIHRKNELRASKVMQERVFANDKVTVIWNSQIEEIGGEQKVEKVIVNSKLKGQKSRPKDDQPLAEKINITSQNIDKEVGIEELGGKLLKSENEQAEWEFPIDGVFVAIGHEPNSKVFSGIDTDEKGYIKVTSHTKTNIPGVFVAGDVYDHEYKQAITAAGLGCMAALDTEKYLQELS